MVEYFNWRLFLSGNAGRDEAAGWLRDAVDSAGEVEGAPLQPMRHARQAWKRGSPDLLFSGAPVLTHAGFAEAASPATWYVAFLWRGWSGGSVVTLSVPVAPLDAGGHSRSWRLAAALAGKVVSRPGVTLGLANGARLTDRPTAKDLLPAEPGVGLPPIWTPWTWVDADRARPHRAALAALPAWRSEALGDGWVVEATREYDQEVAPGLTAAITQLGGSVWRKAPWGRRTER